MDWSAVRKVDPVFGQTARPEMRFFEVRPDGFVKDVRE
jgi:hypothetical protein